MCWWKNNLLWWPRNGFSYSLVRRECELGCTWCNRRDSRGIGSVSYTALFGHTTKAKLCGYQGIYIFQYDRWLAQLSSISDHCRLRIINQTYHWLRKLSNAEFYRAYYLCRVMFRRMEHDYYQYRVCTFDSKTWKAYSTLNWCCYHCRTNKPPYRQSTPAAIFHQLYYTSPQ